MKHFIKTLVLLVYIIAGIATLRAQDCASGFCPENVVVHHVEGTYSAQTVDLTYNFIEIDGKEGGTYCWLDRNIGASTVCPERTCSFTSYGWYFYWRPLPGLHPWYTSDGETASSNDYIGSYILMDPEITSDLSLSDRSDVCSVLFGPNCVTPSINELSDIKAGAYGGGISENGADVMEWFTKLFVPPAGYITTTNNSSGSIVNSNFSSTQAHQYGNMLWSRTYAVFSTYSRASAWYWLYDYYDNRYSNTSSNPPYHYALSIRCIMKL